MDRVRPIRRAPAMAGALLAVFLALAGAAVSLAEPEASTIVPSPDSLGTMHVRLGRATLERKFGNSRGVVESLEPADFSSPSSPESDRAAFLLAQTYLELGSFDRFERLAEQVGRWSLRTPYTRWLGHQLAALRAGGTVLTPQGETVLHSLLEGVSGPGAAQLTRYARAARSTAGGRDEAALAEIAAGDTTTLLGRTLVGAALLELAARQASRGEDPRRHLERVPATSPYASRARHMWGVAAMERGEIEGGTRALRALLAQDSSYAGRGAAWLALAAPALDTARWEEAHDGYRWAETEWSARRSGLERVLAAGPGPDLWREWEASLWGTSSIPLDVSPIRSATTRMADAAADPPTQFGPPSLAEATSPGRRARLVPAPPPEAWDALATSSRDLAEIRYELASARWALAREDERLADERRFLSYGRQLASEEGRALATLAASSDSLRRALDIILGELRTDHDATRRWAERRVATIRERSDRQLLWLAAMRHYYLGGPQGQDLNDVPPSFPSPDEVMAHEKALAEAIHAAAERFAARLPSLLARVRDGARGTPLRDRPRVQESEIRRLDSMTKSLVSGLEGAVASRATSAELKAWTARIRSLETSADSMSRAHATLESRLAEEAVRRAIAELDAEREAIDYGLAASSYGKSVSLLRADSAAVASVAEPPEAAAWRGRAIGYHEAFLERHPESPARGEMRFRLADLLLVAGRQEFRERMERFVRATQAGQRAELPVLDPSRALSLYDAILEEDRDFAHRDAVLRNAGTILADGGDARAERYFQELVTAHPESPFGQEAYLRMGDLHFLEKRFDTCIPLFESATAGSDTGLTLIALYKKGWAEFNLDRFQEAADDFRAILDLYEAGRTERFAVDVRKEAEAYLIHSLARAGGADAFALYFDAIGRRPYEMRLLLAMGQHFRRYGLYAEAAATDQLHVERDPLHPDALLSAERMIDTYRRWDRPETALEAELAYAKHFAPGSEWSKAQASDSTRAAGAAFAKSCWAAVASHHRREAARTDSAAEWQAALDLYQSLLSHWPKDPEAPAVALLAGEASAELGDFEGALAHYATAAASPGDTIPEVALHQRVAVTDAWYQTTRDSASATATGSDTLAKAVLAAGDELLRRFPAHRGAEDVIWRQGNLAFAHGWYERAAEDFERMRSLHPRDPRAPLGAALRADAFFRTGRYEEAGAAFETALTAARQAGQDTLARRAEKSIPICYFRQAEAAVAADTSAYARHAALFERVAGEWPDYEHAELAQYRAGLAWIRAGETARGVAAMRRLVERFPDGEYARDAQLQIAEAWTTAGNGEQAARAYAEFADRYPGDASAEGAVLESAELFAKSGRTAEADTMRLSYLRRFPGDVETGMEILEEFARRELASVNPERPISRVLAASPGKPSHLREYVARAEKTPDLASADLLAEVRFRQAEEARVAYEAKRLSLPLETSIAAKQKELDATIALYRDCVERGVPRWAHAAAFRIGQALASFGSALEASERPSDLGGDDLAAYEDVLSRESMAFYDRAAGVWSDLLAHSGGTGDDEWLTQARASLYERLAVRFLYRAEVDYPVVAGQAPVRTSAGPSAPGAAGDGAKEPATYARGDGGR